MGWRNRPTFKHSWNKDIDYIMFIDENGDASIDHIIKALKNNKPINGNTFFTITGCLMHRDDFLKSRDDILKIKYKYWENGLALYSNKSKRVCFHSREIRGRKHPFDNNSIEVQAFMNDLSEYMKDLPITIFSYTMDKKSHCSRYSDPYSPYTLGLEFIFERLVKYHMNHDEKVIIIIESRGKKEDKELLNHIKDLIDYGTRYVSNSYFKKIKGVYFNPKWSKEDDYKKSYFGLEIADLVSFPIHKYCRNAFCNKDLPFLCIEDKIYGCPDYYGKGIKTFPIIKKTAPEGRPLALANPRKI